MFIFGVRVDNFTLEQAKNKALEFLKSARQHKIFTPNPEMLVDARKDAYFNNVLNNGDLNLCDGFGLALLSGCQRIAGIDFMLEICKIAEKERKNVYLLGSGNDEAVKKTADNLLKQFPTLTIVGYDKGEELKIENCALMIADALNKRMIKDINISKADILLVAFGHGKQEKWIHENLANLPGVKIAMGVGGAFDYISGRVRRAPRLMRQIGLEWLYRLMTQPRRISRIWRATVVFLWLCLVRQK